MSTSEVPAAPEASGGGGGRAAAVESAAAGGGGVRLSAVDYAWLRMDEPANLMQINGVLVLGEPVAVERIKAIARRRLLPIPRFRQRVVARGGDGGGGRPRWAEDTGFDLDRHVLEVRLPAPGDDAALAAMIGELMSTPLAADRPLWELRLVQGYGGGCALLGRIHHSIGDGVALMLVLLSLTDLEPSGPAAVEPLPDEPEADLHGRGNPFTDLFCHPSRDLARIRALADEISPDLMRLLHKPVEALRSARLLTGIGSVVAFGRLVGRRADPRTAFKGPLGRPKLVAWSEALPLAEIKAAGRVLGGTINDVLVSAAAAALRHYLSHTSGHSEGPGPANPASPAHHANPANPASPASLSSLRNSPKLPRRLDIRAAMPVNLRPLDKMSELGNHFGLVFLSLPLGIADPLERLAEVRRRSASLRRSLEPVVVYAILRALGAVPLAVQRLVVKIFATKATLVMTNVPGPRQTLYLAGKPIGDIFFWVPQSGRVGLGLSILSYNGAVRLGVGTDAGLVPDPQAIVAGFHAELDLLLRLARQRGA